MITFPVFIKDCTLQYSRRC